MQKNHPVIRRKKLIEVAMPLEVINDASIREKSIRHGHPSTIHLWWSRKPLATARAVLFCQLVDDPSSNLEEFPTIDAQEKERSRLFKIITELVKWENTSNQEIIKKAQNEIHKSWNIFCADNNKDSNASELFDPKVMPSFHDPFAGGGGIPLEAKRLGLKSFGSDLNPVAVLITKAMIEIPSLFSGYKPVNPEISKQFLKSHWEGSEGLKSDIKYYGNKIYNEAKKHIGNIYPNINISQDLIKNRHDLEIHKGKTLQIITWIWVRTVKSPNPTFSHVDVPLASTFFLSKKKGKEVFIKPIITGDKYKFSIEVGKPVDLKKTNNGTSLGPRSGFRCLMSDEPISYEYIRNEGRSGRMSVKLLAIVARSDTGRIYLEPTKEQENIALDAKAKFKIDVELPSNTRDFKTPLYGLNTFGDLFTDRQLITLNTFTELVKENKKLVLFDSIKKGLKNDSKPLSENGRGAQAYAEAISIYLAFAIDRMANTLCTLARWTPEREQTVTVFARQALPMNWVFPDVNPFSMAAGDYKICVEGVIKGIPSINGQIGFSFQKNAANQNLSLGKIVSTDPPYYDNIGYSDLSDFFYIWLRKSVINIFPKEFSTITVPKNDEIYASPFRYKDKENAQDVFLKRMTDSMRRISTLSHKAFPITIYYAYKQTENKTSQGISSTGWETFLSAVFNSGLAIVGTWPIRTELSNRMLSSGTNVLASSIVLVCEAKKNSSEIITRSEFRNRLRKKLPLALTELERANIAPVDIAQAAIGPGIAIFSQVNSVANPNDSLMSVKEALEEINSALDEYLSKDDLELDIDTRFALTFFESFGYSERPFGDAEGLAKARNVSVEGIVRAGILKSVGGKVNLIKRENLSQDWDPLKDDRLGVWEATQYLIRTLEIEGEVAASKLLNTLKNISGFGNLATSCRSLAYRLYNHCEKNKQAEEARSYNSLIISWPELEKISADKINESKIQTNLF